MNNPLIERCAIGDPNAQTQLIEEYGSFVQRCCACYTSGLSVDEAAQVVILKLIEKSPELLDHPSISGWLQRTSFFVCRQMQRSEQRRNQAERKGAVAMIEHAREGFDVETEQLLHEALCQLPSVEHQVITLHYFEEQTQSAIAEALSCSVGLVNKKIKSGMKTIHKFFHKKGHPVQLSVIILIFGQWGDQLHAASAPDFFQQLDATASTHNLSLFDEVFNNHQTHFSRNALLALGSVLLIAAVYMYGSGNQKLEISLSAIDDTAEGVIAVSKKNSDVQLVLLDGPDVRVRRVLLKRDEKYEPFINRTDIETHSVYSIAIVWDEPRDVLSQSGVNIHVGSDPEHVFHGLPDIIKSQLRTLLGSNYPEQFIGLIKKEEDMGPHVRHQLLLVDLADVMVVQGDEKIADDAMIELYVQEHSSGGILKKLFSGNHMRGSARSTAHVSVSNSIVSDLFNSVNETTLAFRDSYLKELLAAYPGLSNN